MFASTYSGPTGYPYEASEKTPSKVKANTKYNDKTSEWQFMVIDLSYNNPDYIPDPETNEYSAKYVRLGFSAIAIGDTFTQFDVALVAFADSIEAIATYVNANEKTTCAHSITATKNLGDQGHAVVCQLCDATVGDVVAHTSTGALAQGDNKTNAAKHAELCSCGAEVWVDHATTGEMYENGTHNAATHQETCKCGAPVDVAHTSSAYAWDSEHKAYVSTCSKCPEYTQQPFVVTLSVDNANIIKNFNQNISIELPTGYQPQGNVKGYTVDTSNGTFKIIGGQLIGPNGLPLWNAYKLNPNATAEDGSDKYLDGKDQPCAKTKAGLHAVEAEDANATAPEGYEFTTSPASPTYPSGERYGTYSDPVGVAARYLVVKYRATKTVSFEIFTNTVTNNHSITNASGSSTATTNFTVSLSATEGDKWNIIVVDMAAKLEQGTKYAEDPFVAGNPIKYFRWDCIEGWTGFTKNDYVEYAYVGFAEDQAKLTAALSETMTNNDTCPHTFKSEYGRWIRRR